MISLFAWLSINLKKHFNGRWEEAAFHLSILSIFFFLVSFLLVCLSVPFLPVIPTASDRHVFINCHGSRLGLGLRALLASTVL